MLEGFRLSYLMLSHPAKGATATVHPFSAFKRIAAVSLSSLGLAPISLAPSSRPAPPHLTSVPAVGHAPFLVLLGRMSVNLFSVCFALPHSSPAYCSSGRVRQQREATPI